MRLVLTIDELEWMVILKALRVMADLTAEQEWRKTAAALVGHLEMEGQNLEWVEDEPSSEDYETLEVQ